VDINSVACIRFANGGYASLTCGGNCPTWTSNLYFQGDGAQLEISPHGGNFRVVSQTKKLDIRTVPEGWDVPTVSPVRNFADVIMGKATPRCGGRVGILLADLMDALYASAASGKTVKVK
jgi:predicted dehydrogenase